MISGGATSTLPLLLEKKVPNKINHLRIGEGIVTAKDLPELWDVHIPGLFTDPMTLKAQIVEVKTKPSYPIGEIFIDAFGNKPEYKDRGKLKRAILAMGSKDIGDYSKIKSNEHGIKIIGSSSDHLIVDIEEYPGELKVGDVLEFDIFYPAMLFLSSSECVRKIIT
jgi:predicted amino acid racemase